MQCQLIIAPCETICLVLLESEINSKEDALTIANDPEARELGDAYALLARVYAGPRFTWEESNFPRTICVPINAYTIVFAVVVLLVPYKRCALKVLLRQLWKRICKSPLMHSIVHDYAEQDDDAYCQCWRDDNRIEAAKI